MSKRFQHNAVNYIIFSNLLIAACAGVLTFAVCRFVDKSNFSLCALSFSSTLFAYTALRLRNVKKGEGDIYSWIAKNRIIVYFLLFSSFSTTIYFASILLWCNLNIILVLIISSLLFVLYFGINQKLNIRRISILKTAIVALVWVLSTTILTLVYFNQNVKEFLPIISLIFCLILALTIPFEIRDVKWDEKDENLQTIPMLFGIKNTKRISYLLLIICSIITINYFPNLSFFSLPFFAIIALTIYRLNENSHEYWFTGVLDFYLLIYGSFLVFQFNPSL